MDAGNKYIEAFADCVFKIHGELRLTEHADKKYFVVKTFTDYAMRHNIFTVKEHPRIKYAMQNGTVYFENAVFSNDVENNPTKRFAADRLNETLSKIDLLYLPEKSEIVDLPSTFDKMFKQIDDLVVSKSIEKSSDMLCQIFDTVGSDKKIKVVEELGEGKVLETQNGNYTFKFDGEFYLVQNKTLIPSTKDKCDRLKVALGKKLNLSIIDEQFLVIKDMRTT